MGVSRCIARWATLVVFTTAILQPVGGRQWRAVYPRPVVRLLHFKLSTTVTKYFLYAQIVVCGRVIKSFTVWCSIFAGYNLFIAWLWVARVACPRHVSRRRACRGYRVRCATDTPRTYDGWRQHRQRRRRSQGRAARATPAPRPASALWRHRETSEIHTTVHRIAPSRALWLKAEIQCATFICNRTRNKWQWKYPTRKTLIFYSFPFKINVWYLRNMYHSDWSFGKRDNTN